MLTRDALFGGDLLLEQSEDGYRFSMDAVFLAEMTKVLPNDRIIDLGTGCGVVPMILAHRRRGHTWVGIEIQPELAELARRNVITNQWDARNRELTETRRQLEQRNRDLERISALDTLTQIANRRRFDAVLRQEWRRAVRDESPFSLLFCDIDHFKRFNDTYGHQPGDECLVRLAQAMEETLNRPADIVARYGGEEFIALLVDTDAEGARMLAERMRARIEGLQIENRASSVGPWLTVSLGVATIVPRAAARPEDLVDLADRALYAAKESGRNRVSTADQLPAVAVPRTPAKR